MKTVKLKKAHPSTFLGSTKTGANGRKAPALWNIVDADTGEVLARLYNAHGQWFAAPAAGPDSFDFGAFLSRRYAPTRAAGLAFAAEALGATVAK